MIDHLLQTVFRLTVVFLLLATIPLPAKSFAADPADSESKSVFTEQQLQRLDERNQAVEQRDQFLRDGKFTDAADSAKTIVAIDREVLGEQHPDLFTALKALIKIQAYNDDQAGFQKSLAELTTLQSKGIGAGGWRSVEVQKLNDFIKLFTALDAPQRDKLRQAEQLNMQAVKLGDDGKYNKALPLASQAFEIRQQLLGVDERDTLDTLSNIGWFHRDLEEYQQAETIFRDVLERRQKLFGQQHPDVGLSNNILGWLYLNQRDFKSAEPFFRRAEDVYLNTMGQSNEDYLTTLDNLGELYVRAADYSRAEVLRTQVVEIRRKIGTKHETDYARSLRRLALVYEYQEQYEKAKTVLNEAFPIFKQNLGDDSQETMKCLGDLEYCYESLNDFERALPLCEQTLEIQRRILGPENSEVGITLYHLASIYIGKEDYVKALDLNRQALEIFRKSIGEDAPNFQATQNLVGKLLDEIGYERQESGDLTGARQIFAEKFDFDLQRFGEKHWQIINDRQSIAYVDRLEKMIPAERAELSGADKLFRKARELAKTNQIGLAIESTEKALEIDRRLLGDEHPKTISCLMQVSYFYKEMGDLAKAEPIYRQLPDLVRKVEGENHPDYYTCLHNLANLYETRGSVSQVQATYEQALEVARKIYGDEHENVARTIASLAVLHDNLGHLGKAESLYKQSLNIFKTAVGQNDPDYAGALLRLGGFYSGALDDDSKAEPFLLQAVEIYKFALGDKHPDYARALDYLATLYIDTEHYDRAEPLRQQALAIVKEAFGEKHPAYADMLNKLGVLYTTMGDYPKAESFFLQALNTGEQIFGKDSALNVLPLSNLSNIYLYTEQYEKSEALARRALELYRRKFGEQNLEYADALARVAGVTHFTGHLENSVTLARQALQIGKAQLEQNASVQSERQQLATRNKVSHLIETYMDATAAAGTSGEDVYTDLADWKGIIAATQQHLRHVHRQLQQTGNQDAVRIESELQDATRTLAGISQSAQNHSPDVQFRRQELSDKIESLQQQFAQTSDGAQLELKPVTLDDVRSALPANIVLVDFIAYQHCVPDKEKTKDEIYQNKLSAFVVRKGKPVVRVELGPTKPIEDAIQAWRNNFGRRSSGFDPGAQLRQLVWQPLEKHIQSVDKILISPNAITAPIPWAALPGSKPGKYLIDEVAVSLIPIPRLLPEMLAVEKPSSDNISNNKQNGPSLLLVGDVDFGADPGAGAAPLIDRLAARGGEQFNWPALAGTRDEVASIESSFGKQFQGAHPIALTQNAATKNAVLQAMAVSQYIHFSTHGFFAPDPATPSGVPKTADSRGALVTSQHVANFQLGLLSGLVLAGANRHPADGKEDGILTALEVEEMDLHAVQLATLSACETGLGKSAGGEGLLGLQRSFQIAGAKTVLASLWKVPDKATQVLMARFYDNLWHKHMSKIESLREAQRWLLHEKTGQRDLTRGLDLSADSDDDAQFSGQLSPRYWAAFELSGDWR